MAAKGPEWHFNGIPGRVPVRACIERLGSLVRRCERCSDALDFVESKQLSNGGWAAEKKYYKTSKAIVLNGDYVDWGPTGKNKMNEWVSADALYVLREAGRI